MVLPAAWCGLRFGEITELRRHDFDLTNGVVKIRRAVVRVNGEFIIGTPKSDAGTRDVSIPPHLFPVVKAHSGDNITGGRDGLLFPAAGDPTKHLAPATLYKVFYKAREEAGRPDLRFHDLRHTGAVPAASTGATPGRTDGPPRTLHRRRSTALPTRGQKPRQSHSRSPVEPGDERPLTKRQGRPVASVDALPAASGPGERQCETGPLCSRGEPSGRGSARATEQTPNRRQVALHLDSDCRSVTTRKPNRLIGPLRPTQRAARMLRRSVDWSAPRGWTERHFKAR
ncbi:site-specific integrase [Nocardioides sp. B-3]|uniref:site-specific integrase n=1 Tax=Nocardioides sp. B-3 TaxID=2895565 RepID=UPI003FA52321